MLLVVAHPVVGTGLETLLRLERYDVRRIARLDEGRSLSETWRPDVALVDGLLLKNGDRAALGAPAFVLSGDAAGHDAARDRLDDVRGWLRKDATADELRAAIDRVLGPPPAGLRVRRATLIRAAAAAAVGAFLLWGWLALRSAG